MRAALRHGLACVALLPILAILPGVAGRLSWELSALFGETAGAQSSVTSGFTNPLKPVPLVLLGIVSVVAILVEAGRKQHRWVVWVVPAVAAVVLGVVLGAMSWAGLPRDLPLSVPLVIGLTATACVLFLAVIYGSVLGLTSLWFSRGSAQG